MSPTMAFKNRLEQEERIKHLSESAPVSFPMLGEPRFQDRAQSADNTSAAILLLSMGRLVANEIQNDEHLLDSDEDADERSTTVTAGMLSDSFRPIDESSPSSRVGVASPTSSDDEVRFGWSRVRSVSIDSPTPYAHETSSSIVTPMSSPVAKARPIRKASLRMCRRAQREHRNTSDIAASKPKKTISHAHPTPARTMEDTKEHRERLLQTSIARGATIKKILRKKFSWKNYPELEAFLIANRAEYLRHSALNYTIQQKQYNNKLTERLLELAAEHGYVFDEEEFSFVTVRDRIRCYFKSYVQSAKKRGVIIGYAARKAGLLSEDDLEKSSELDGEIVTPMESCH